MWNCPSSIWRQFSNSQPSDYESPPLTTRPGLPPNNNANCFIYYLLMVEIKSQIQETNISVNETDQLNNGKAKWCTWESNL